MENKKQEGNKSPVKIKQAKRRKSLEKALRENLKRRKQPAADPAPEKIS